MTSHGFCRKKWPEDPLGSARRAKLLNRCEGCAYLTQGCPIGEVAAGWRVWDVVGQNTVQISRTDEGGKRRWRVAAFFPGRRLDLRFPVQYFKSRPLAVSIGLDYAKHYLGRVGCTVEDWPNGEDWSVRGPSGESILVMLVRRS